MINSDQLSKQQFKTWFQYRGNKQFGPFFGAEFYPNGHKIMKNVYFFNQNNLTNKIHQIYYFGDDCMSSDKIIKKRK